MHLPVYGLPRMLALLEMAAEFHKVKRGQRNDVMDRIVASQQMHM